MGNEELLEQATTAILGRGVERALATDTRIYHDLKMLATLVGIIVAVAVQLGAFLLDPKLTLGGTRKKAL